MREAEAFVELALKSLGCNQKELAHRLRVSESQITKWKQGESMSGDVEKKFRGLLNICDKYPEFVLTAGSLENAEKWEDLILRIARATTEDTDTGYDSSHVLDEPDMLCMFMFWALEGMGVEIPKTFPTDLDMQYDETDPDDEPEGADQRRDDFHEAYWSAINDNPYSSMIHRIFNSFADVDGFYQAYISDLLEHDDERELVETILDIIQPELLRLAASKIALDKNERVLAKKFDRFCSRTHRDYEKALNTVKKEAFRAGIPLPVELMDLVNKSHSEIGEIAERESLGFNKHQLHPDIYMNELLTGMRMIHQVLPAIMKKLGIYEEFKLHASELCNYPTREGDDDEGAGCEQSQ